MTEEELARLGLSSDDPPPWFRITAWRRSANGRALLVDLYKEEK